jgi:magnesium chelatase family protein
VAKRALEIAAAGGHNLLMLGPPGSGKTMLAKAFTALLPDLPGEAALEVAAVYSLCAAIPERNPASLRPPFRAPHHSISRAGLIGGGLGLARPGEISLAHQGVLFVDEFCEFSRSHIEALRQPLEDRRITVVRARGAVTFPADFILVAAANPCPCGYAGDARVECTCTAPGLAAYQARISGPVRDRIDLMVDVPRPAIWDLFGSAQPENSAAVRARVLQAREQQLDRSGVNNARLDADLLLETCHIGKSAMSFLTTAAERLNLSARAGFRTLRVARTIADLEAKPRVDKGAIAEALRYRAGEMA